MFSKFRSLNFPDNWEIVVSFLVLLFIALFLGDGLQPLVDVFIAGGIVSLAIYTLKTKKPVGNFTGSMYKIWTILIGYYVLRTFFSDSVGLSISALIRLLLGYAVFFIFARYLSHAKQIRFFLNTLIAVSTLIAFVSILLIIFPVKFSWLLNLPQMNLLYPFFGHHHLPSLLFFTLPLVLFESLNNKNRWYKVALLIYALIFFISFSKSALLVLGLYFTYLFLKGGNFNRLKNSLMSLPRFMSFSSRFNRGKIQRESEIPFKIKNNDQGIWWGIAALLTFGLVLSVITASVLNLERFAPSFYQTWLHKQIDKSPSPVESRGHYWQQAFDAWKTNPIIGRGPGTFYLLSKRFQTTSNSYSYFAHSWPLELLAETGLVGLVLWFLLIFKIVFPNRNSTTYNLSAQGRPASGWQPSTHNSQQDTLYPLPTTPYSPLTTPYSLLSSGIFLVLALSLFDFNLSFIINWLLLHTFLGILSSNSDHHVDR